MIKNYKKRLIFVFIGFSITLAVFGNIYVEVISERNIETRFMFSIIVRLLLTIITTYIVIKEDIFRLNKLFKHSYSYIVLSGIIGFFLYKIVCNSINEYDVYISVYTHLLYSANVLTVGLFEELFCRILIFGYVFCIINHGEEKNILIKSVIITSLIFGALHLLNIFSPYYEKLSVISQSVFAFGLAVLFQSILIKTQNIIFVVFLHAFVNYIMEHRTKLLQVVVDNSPYTYSDFIQTIIFFVVLIIFIIFPISYLLLTTSHNFIQTCKTNNSIIQ